MAVVLFSLLPDAGPLSAFLSSFRFRTDQCTVSRDLHASGSCMFESGTERLGTNYNISLKVSVIANDHSSQLLYRAMSFSKNISIIYHISYSDENAFIISQRFSAEDLNGVR